MTEVPKDDSDSLDRTAPGNPEQREGEFADAPPGAAAASGPLARSDQQDADWYRWCIDLESGGKSQAAPPSLPPLLTAPPCGIYEVFRRQVIELCGFRRIVEEKMASLSDYYRSIMGATLLQLCAWAYPKGCPPRALYWIRLERRNPELDDRQAIVVLPKRRRWYRLLSIKNRTDMNSHIYWNGMAEARDLVLQFYERAKSLNGAHAKLARRTPHLVRTCRGALRDGDIGWLEMVSGRIHQDPAADLLNGSGPKILSLCWALAKAVEIFLHDLNGYLRRRPEGRIQLLSRPDWRNVSYIPGRGPIKVRWLFRDPLTGRTSHSLRQLTRKNCPGMPEGGDASDVHSGEMLRCMVGAEGVLKAIRRIGDRMEEIRQEASDILDCSDPLEEYYSPPGSV